MDKVEIVDQARNKVKEGKLEEALLIVLDYVERKDIISLSARMNILKGEMTKGTITFEQSSVEKNKIAYALLNVLDDIRDERVKSSRISRKIKYLASLLRKGSKRKLYLLFLFLERVWEFYSDSCFSFANTIEELAR